MAGTQMNDPATLLDNIDLLVRNAERITADPRLAAVTHPSASLSMAYVGDGLVPIGPLLRLWATGVWTSSCALCRGRVLITSVGGSPLSGGHGWSGVCSACRERVSYRDAPGVPQATLFAPLWTAALPSMVRRQPPLVLTRGRATSLELLPRSDPPPKGSAMEFAQLIDVLRHGEVDRSAQSFA